MGYYGFVLQKKYAFTTVPAYVNKNKNIYPALNNNLLNLTLNLQPQAMFINFSLKVSNKKS